jgi:hypothetical protein
MLMQNLKLVLMLVLKKQVLHMVNLGLDMSRQELNN